ncbi:hypothetical protein HH310_19555 [Actinoplanes sp. TBRC 11911]|uniref:alpha/beta fold hydrolase n=1 Tax=Actinoplanes sp. TBRC 11911 TaxID=2729386 RepID=UPI00145DD421|nr:hypothetical protein [Actinoplanes sp. TBRC 11911]NMO53376.1 hypothetical protein [Actinoplanes sp. TBRC 11911]
MVALVPTWVRELRVIDSLVGNLDGFKTIDQRTLLLLGSNTPAHHVDAARFLDENLPRTMIEWVDGADHLAMVTHPIDMANAIAAFLRQR